MDRSAWETAQTLMMMMTLEAVEKLHQVPKGDEVLTKSATVVASEDEQAANEEPRPALNSTSSKTGKVEAVHTAVKHW